MTPKQILYFIIFLIILLMIAIGISTLSEDRTKSDDVAIENDFGSKVVYGIAIGPNLEPFKNDCRERGGQFNTCGNICDPEAEVCADVCAFTCDNIPELDVPEEDTATVPEDWVTYSTPSLNFEIMHPPEMNVTQEERGVNFTVWGPTQIEGSEFFDGISLTIRELDIPTGMNLNDFAREQMNEEHRNPVRESFEDTTLGGREAFRFRAMGEIDIPTTYIYTTSSQGKVYEISYTAEDPANQGFRQMVQKMLDTFDTSA